LNKADLTVLEFIVFAHACKMGLEGIEASGVQQRIIGRRRKLAGRLSGIA
jgi:hypothetical protein